MPTEPQLSPTSAPNLTPQASPLTAPANQQPSRVALTHEEPTPGPLALADPTKTPAARESLDHLLNPQLKPNFQLIAVNHAASFALAMENQPDHQLSTVNHQLTHKSRRKGRIASLPKLQRDMVNRMIQNGVPYKNIVAALDDAEYTGITERNVSNWATGGYLEWQFEQDLVLQNRLDQDHLVDHLRREDASELPEVGLQAAATRLSQILLEKTARADDVERNLPAFSQMVDVLCRLNHEIGALQKQRDDSCRTLGPAHDAARIRNEEQKSTFGREQYFSNPDDAEEAGLEVPAEPPLLPPLPTSSDLEIKDLQEERRRQRERNAETMAIMQALYPKNASTPAEPKTSTACADPSQPLPANLTPTSGQAAPHSATAGPPEPAR